MDEMTLLRNRLEMAVKLLTKMAYPVPRGLDESVRLNGKLEGVRLALSYLDEEVRCASARILQQRVMEVNPE